MIRRLAASIPGVDRRQLDTLVDTYRKVGTYAASHHTPSGYTPRMQLLLYGFMGALVGQALIEEAPLMVFATIAHSMTLFLVGMAATVEAGPVLFDPGEVDVLLHRPIAPATLLAAKSVEMLRLTLGLALAINVFPILLGPFVADARWWVPLVHLATVVLMCVFICAGVVFVYGAVIKVFGKDRFETIATWAQIGISIILLGGYQIAPHVISRMPASAANVHDTAYLMVVPSTWFAGLDVALAGRSARTADVVLGGTAVVVTLVLAALAFVRLAPAYGEALPELASGRNERRAPKRVGIGPVARLWTRGPVERAAYRLAIAHLARDRATKLQVYPGILMLAVFPLITIGQPDSAFTRLLLAGAMMMAAVAPLQAMEALRFSDQPHAADIFFISPNPDAAGLFHGVRKACVLRLFPLCAVLPIAMFYLAHPDLLATALRWALPVIAVTPLVSLLPAVWGFVPLATPRIAGMRQASTMTLWMTVNSGMMALMAIVWLTDWLGVFWYFLALEATAAATGYVLAGRALHFLPLEARVVE